MRKVLALLLSLVTTLTLLVPATWAEEKNGWVSAASFSEGQDGHSAHQRRAMALLTNTPRLRH